MAATSTAGEDVEGAPVDVLSSKRHWMMNGVLCCRTRGFIRTFTLSELFTKAFEDFSPPCCCTDASTGPVVDKVVFLSTLR